MPHYAFIKRVMADGREDYFAHSVRANSKKEAKSLVLSDFKRYSIHADEKRPLATLVDLMDFGECSEGYENSGPLYEKCCKKVDKLRQKQGEAASNPEGVPVVDPMEDEAVEPGIAV